ncbi:MAG: alpha/beta hydrolase, partial [Alphaproteobacteria bacterium]
LILFGGYVRGRLLGNTDDTIAHYEAGKTMIRAGWGSPNPAFRNFFTSNFIPDATPEQAASFDELQRVSITAENAERIYEINCCAEVSELAKRVKVPTLVLNCDGDRVSPLAEGRRMAALIPGARFVTLEGNNHVVTAGTPAFTDFIREIESFVGEHSSDI